MSILIVEDDDGILFSLCMYLKEMKQKHIKSKSVKQTLDILDGVVPRVILLDYLLEDGDATPIIERVKNMPSNMPLLVLMSAYSDIDSVAEAHKITNVLKKPFSIDDLDKYLPN